MDLNPRRLHLTHDATRADEVRALQGFISDLISIQALSAISDGRESSRIVGTLLDALVSVLRLDFAYARLSDADNGPAVELVRQAQWCRTAIHASEVGRALAGVLVNKSITMPLAVPNPTGSGEIRIAPLRLGLLDEIGVLVAGSKRADFPTQTETLLLRVAANQSMVALLEAHALNVQARIKAAGELDVIERTEQSATNVELRKKVAEQKQAQMEQVVEMLERNRAAASLTAAKSEAERRAREAEQAQSILLTIMEYAPEGITLTGGPPDFPIIANSKHVAEMVGKEAGTLLHIPAGSHAATYGLLHPATGTRPHPEELPLYRASRYGEVIENEEWLIERPDGERIETLSNVAPIRDFGGQVIGAINWWRDITGRKRAEEALRASEERFRRYFNLGLIGMAITTPAKGCLEVNDELCRMLGYERNELLQKNWEELTHPDDLAADLAEFNRVLAGEIDGYTIDKRWIRKDGSVNNTIMSAKCVRRSDSGIDYFIALVLDVTARKRAEKALRRSEANLAEGQRLSHTGSWAWNVASGEVYWSAELFRIYGLDPAQVTPGYPSVLNHIHPEDRQRVQQTFENAVREQRKYELAYRVARPDGTIRHVNDLGHPVINGAGLLIEYVGTTIDTTERELVEEKLRHSESLLAEGQALSHTGSWVWNVTSGELQWSDEHFRIFGFAPGSIQPTTTTTEKLIHPEDRYRVELALERAVRERSDFRVEFRILLANGATRHLLNLGRVLTEKFPAVEFIGVVMDMTELKRSEEALRVTRNELAHVTRVTMMGELAASIAHEMNQPLAAIVVNGQACTRWIAAKPANLTEAHAAAQRIVRDANRASEVIARIRTFLKRDEPQLIPFDINELIREVLDMVQSEIQALEVVFQVLIAAGQPHVMGDRVQIQQVILSLVINALEAMAPVRQRTHILRVGVRAYEEDTLLVWVRDSGVGLGPAQRERIFEAFNTSKSNGMGMGLAISRSIVEAHGGRLWANANADHGETFQFTLQLAAELE